MSLTCALTGKVRLDERDVQGLRLRAMEGVAEGSELTVFPMSRAASDMGKLTSMHTCMNPNCIVNPAHGQREVELRVRGDGTCIYCDQRCAEGLAFD